jgi:hypothetical protein
MVRNCGIPSVDRFSPSGLFSPIPRGDDMPDGANHCRASASKEDYGVRAYLRLDFEAGAVHRYLTTAGQPNPYLQAVEDNLSEIRRRLQAGTG